LERNQKEGSDKQGEQAAKQGASCLCRGAAFVSYASVSYASARLATHII
jgi:hypothetical protein